MSQMRVEPQYFSDTVQANWKLCLHITFDRYSRRGRPPEHIRKVGICSPQEYYLCQIRLAQCGSNSPDPQALEKMSAACRDGTFRFGPLPHLPNLSEPARLAFSLPTSSSGIARSSNTFRSRMIVRRCGPGCIQPRSRRIIIGTCVGRVRTPIPSARS